MHIPKAYLINGILLLVAIGSWSLFIRQNFHSRNKAANEAFAASFLNRHLPETVSDIQLKLDLPDDQSIEAFPSLKGKKIFASEIKQIEMRVVFYLAMMNSRVTEDHRDWTRLGTAFIASGDKDIVEFQVFTTPNNQLGFYHNGSYNQAAGDIGGILEFIREIQNTKTANDAIHRTPTRWHAECLVASLPALVAPAVRCR